MALEDEPPLKWWGILLIVLGCTILVLVIIILILIICRYHKWGRVFPYDEETPTRKMRKKKPKQKARQTQTSPAHRQMTQKSSEAPTGTLLSDRRSHPPAVLITDATPQATSRDISAGSESSLPGTVDDKSAWASPYPGPSSSTSESKTHTTTTTTHKRYVTVEKVSASDRAVTPSSVVVTSTTTTSSSRGNNSQPKGNLSEQLPNVEDSSKNTRPGKKFTNRVGVE